eukprot:scaffold100743_cov19-Tisochrysis_lutea.AAC.1
MEGGGGRDRMCLTSSLGREGLRRQQAVQGMAWYAVEDPTCEVREWEDDMHLKREKAGCTCLTFFWGREGFRQQQALMRIGPVHSMALYAVEELTSSARQDANGSNGEGMTSVGDKHAGDPSARVERCGGKAGTGREVAHPPEWCAGVGRQMVHWLSRKAGLNYTIKAGRQAIHQNGMLEVKAMCERNHRLHGLCLHVYVHSRVHSEIFSAHSMHARSTHTLHSEDACAAQSTQHTQAWLRQNSVKQPDCKKSGHFWEGMRCSGRRQALVHEALNTAVKSISEAVLPSVASPLKEHPKSIHSSCTRCCSDELSPQ